MCITNADCNLSTILDYNKHFDARTRGIEITSYCDKRHVSPQENLIRRLYLRNCFFKGLAVGSLYADCAREAFP